MAQALNAPTATQDPVATAWAKPRKNTKAAAAVRCEARRGPHLSVRRADLGLRRGEFPACPSFQQDLSPLQIPSSKSAHLIDDCMLPPSWSTFPNEKDACCAWGLWYVLLAVYLCYVVLSTISLTKALEEPDYIDSSDQRMVKPAPSLDVCELLKISEHLQYSLLGQIAVMSQTGWFLKNGTENQLDLKLNVSETFYDPDGKFRCVRFRSTAQVPPEAAVTYYNFYVAVREPVHPKLYRFSGKYIAGLVFRPSLAENATNTFALSEERLVRLFVPSKEGRQGYRNVVCSAVPSFAKWLDTLGGRMGAPSDDTFYFADMTLIPESLQKTSNVMEDSANDVVDAAANPLR
eukprot:s4_g82.t1